MLKFSQSYFVLVAMNVICDTSDGFCQPFQKGPLVYNGSWLFTSSQLTCPATPSSLSLSHAMFTLQPVGGADLAPLPAQQETERRARKRWEGLGRVDG